MQLPIEEQDCRIRQKYEIKRTLGKLTANSGAEEIKPSKKVYLVKSMHVLFM